MEKKIKWMTEYSRLFAKAMKKSGRSDYKALESKFRNKYMDLVSSDEYSQYERYGSITLERVYAAITHALICLEAGISLEESKQIWEEMIESEKKKRSRVMCGLVDKLNRGYKMVANYLDKEARKHQNDGSLTFEILKTGEEKAEYKVTHCVCLEIFEHYGIREFCKVFCNNIHCLEVMQKNAKFTSYSDLVDGEYCRVELTKL